MLGWKVGRPSHLVDQFVNAAWQSKDAVRRGDGVISGGFVRDQVALSFFELEPLSGSDAEPIPEAFRYDDLTPRPYRGFHTSTV